MSQASSKRRELGELDIARFVWVPRRALLISLSLHAVLFVALIVVHVLDRYGVHIFKQTETTHQVYQEFIQVDMVALPDRLVKDLDKFDPSAAAEKDTREAAQPAASEPDQMVLAKAKKARQAKQAQQERDAALKKLRDEAQRERALKALAKKQDAQRAKVAGNVLSKGTAVTGAVGDSRDQYISLVGQKIKQHFNVFSWQRKKGLVAVVHIELYATGRIRSKKLLKRSIDPLYDSAVLQAVDDAQPLPVPSDRQLMQQGITVEFRPES